MTKRTGAGRVVITQQPLLTSWRSLLCEVRMVSAEHAAEMGALKEALRRSEEYRVQLVKPLADTKRTLHDILNTNLC